MGASPPTGLNSNDVYTRSAAYVDRILKGEKPANLPVQAPTKYELIINLKTAKAIGLDSPADAARDRRRGNRVRRREFITLLGGAAAWPLAARAQQRERMRRIGVLMNLGSDDPEGQARIRGVPDRACRNWVGPSAATCGSSIVGARAMPNSSADIAAELVALAPDVILASGAAVVPSLLQATRTVPIVFTGTADPVGAGFVESLARPGGNATGFTNYEYGISGKWLELLKEIAPGITRAAVIRDPAIAAGVGQWGAIQTAAPSLGVELSPLGVRDAGEIERAITAFARSPNGGLIVTGSTLASVHRDLIVTLAARHRLPAVYFARYFVDVGGLISYGPDLIDQYRRCGRLR